MVQLQWMRVGVLAARPIQCDGAELEVKPTREEVRVEQPKQELDWQTTVRESKEGTEMEPRGPNMERKSPK